MNILKRLQLKCSYAKYIALCITGILYHEKIIWNWEILWICHTKNKKNSILETTTLAKKKYIGNYYTNKVLSMSSTSISNKREKTTPTNYLVYDFSKEQK